MVAFNTALFTTLTADSGAGGVATLATGGIHGNQASQDAIEPLLVFQVTDELPDYGIASEYYRNLFVQFKVYGVGEGSPNWSVPGQIADRLEALLIDQTFSITGWTLDYMRMIRRFDLGEQVPDAGITYPVVISEFEIGLVKA